MHGFVLTSSLGVLGKSTQVRFVLRIISEEVLKSLEYNLSPPIFKTVPAYPRASAFLSTHHLARKWEEHDRAFFLVPAREQGA